MRYHSYALTILALGARSLALPDGVGGHHHAGHHTDHGAVSAPAAGYQEPLSGYETPETGYAVADTGYGTPDVYEPADTYSYNYDVQEPYAPAQEESGMSMIMIPLLIAAALFLLFPSVVEVQGGRKRREADDSAAANVVDRIQDMTMALMESEECMERIACEMGGLAEDVGISKSMTKMVEKFAPKKYAKMMKTFNHGKDCKKNNKCGLF